VTEVTENARATRARSLLVLTQDPRFQGGALAQVEAFLSAARALGEHPTVAYAERPPLTGRTPLQGIAVRTRLGRLDPAGLPLAARRLVPHARAAGQLWVVAATAHYGLAALRSRRPYACWIGTSLEAEWRARRPLLERSRRLALRLFGPVLQRYERDVLRGARRIYATSPYSRGALADAVGVDVDLIGVLPIAVDTQRFAPLDDDRWRSAIGRPTLAFVGRADDPRKNTPLLLDAFARVREHIPEARLRLVGRPPAGPSAPGVEAVGEVGDVAAHLRDAALLLLPSFQEGFGIVAAEALACGVPVVTTPSGGPEETLLGSGAGRVLTGFSAEELASVVEELLQDPDTLQAMRRRGRAYVEREHSTARLSELLAEAVADLDRQ
jgi:glycosyltransferase involved in cell wall biosynthesis